MTLFPERLPLGVVALRLGVSEDVVRAIVAAHKLPTEQLVDVEAVRAHLRRQGMPAYMAAQEKSRGRLLDRDARW